MSRGLLASIPTGHRDRAKYSQYAITDTVHFAATPSHRHGPDCEHAEHSNPFITMLINVQEWFRQFVAILWQDLKILLSYPHEAMQPSASPAHEHHAHGPHRDHPHAH